MKDAVMAAGIWPKSQEERGTFHGDITHLFRDLTLKYIEIHWKHAEFAMKHGNLTERMSV